MEDREINGTRLIEFPINNLLLPFECNLDVIAKWYELRQMS
jgi:hypothetical protein